MDGWIIHKSNLLMHIISTSSLRFVTASKITIKLNLLLKLKDLFGVNKSANVQFVYKFYFLVDKIKLSLNKTSIKVNTLLILGKVSVVYTFCLKNKLK